MTNLADLVEFHEISQLKFRYLRAIDGRDWPLLEQCFTQEATASFANGKLIFRGREQIVRELRDLLVPAMVTWHVAVHPELLLTGTATARGIWRMHDMVRFVEDHVMAAQLGIEGGKSLVGAGYYHEDYRKEGGKWRISNIEVVRVAEVRLNGDQGDFELSSD